MGGAFLERDRPTGLGDSEDMKYTHLGRSGLSVSRLCLGTMNFGEQTVGSDAHRIMDAAHDYGINYFDTANSYGDSLGPGATEAIIGTWFAQGGQRRERTVLATKVYGDMSEWPNNNKLSALNIRRALDASLARLKTDYIDIYQFHHVDRNTPWDEIWQAMETASPSGADEETDEGPDDEVEERPHRPIVRGGPIAIRGF